MTDSNFAMFGVGFIIGGLVGMFMVVFAADYRAVKRGWVEHDGKFYVLTPAKPVSAQ